MSESGPEITPTPVPAVTPVVVTRAAAPPVQPIILRDWPKIVMMIPTLVVSIICGVLISLYPDAPRHDAEFMRVHYVGIVFIVVLALNLTMLLYDLSLRGFVVVALLIITMVLVLFLLNQKMEGRVWKAVFQALSVRLWANAAFYFMFAMVLLFNLAIAWVITRFNYWKVENNEIIIHEGFMHEQERHPTAQARFKLVIEDIIEYGMLGSGKLVFYFGDDATQHELTTVLRVHRKAKRLDELLGRVAVTER